MPPSKSRSRKNLEAQLGPPSVQQPTTVARGQETAMQTTDATHSITAAGAIKAVLDVLTGGATAAVNVQPGTNKATPTVEGGSTGQGEVLGAEASRDIKTLNNEGAFQAPLGDRIASAARNAPGQLVDAAGNAAQRQVDEIKRKAAAIKAAGRAVGRGASKLFKGSPPPTGGEGF